MKYLINLSIFFIFSLNLFSQSVYVSPNGDDNNDGSIHSPFKTISVALSSLNSDTIILLNGVYREEIIIDNKNNITITGHDSGNAIIDGTISLNDFSWTNTGNNIFKTTIDTAIWQLFIENKEMVMARWPNAQFSDKSIYSWDTWAEGDEANSINGMLVIDNTKSFYSGLDYTLDTAHAILNVGSFRTWNSKIQYSEGSDFFTYNNVPNSQYKDKHHYFFVEGDLNLLDTLNEWYHNPKTGELWLMTDGTNPNDLDIKGKVSSYSFEIKNSDNITIENLSFFSSTVEVQSAENFILQDCNFAYPSTSKRMLGNLGTPKATSIGISGSSNKANNSFIRRNLFEYTDGDALRVYGDNNTIENNFFQYIDYSVSELPGLMVTLYINGDENIITKNTIENVQASATVSPGKKSKFSYNKVTRTGALQSDGSVFQGTRNFVADSEVHHNYIYNTPKLALRYDAPGDDPSAAGQRGKMYNNVAINTNGIMVKGDYHYIANNTVIGSNKNGMIILDEENSNLNTFTQNNLVDKLSGHRSLSNYEDKNLDGNPDYPVPGTSSNNWNGWDSVKTEYNDEFNIDNTIYKLIDSITLIPLEGSPLIDGGVEISSLPQEIVGSSPDIGAYEYGGIHWSAGIEGWNPNFFPWNFTQFPEVSIILSDNNPNCCDDLKEDSGEFIVTVKLSHPYYKDIIIDLEEGEFGTPAKEGIDFTVSIANDTIDSKIDSLKISAGDTIAYLYLHSIQDIIYEKTENIVYNLQSWEDTVMIINTGFWLTMVDDDPMPSVTMSSGNNIDSIYESNQSINIVLTLSNPSSQDITLSLSGESSPFVPDLAIQDEDYKISVDSLSIPALTTEIDFNITSIQDEVVEVDEVAVINIESITDSIILVLSIIIIDDDNPIPLSIENRLLINSIYPNPASSNLKVQLEEDVKIDNIHFVNLDGKTIKPRHIRRQNKFVEINVSNLNNGVYILNITSDKEVNKVKVVIER